MTRIHRSLAALTLVTSAALSGAADAQTLVRDVNDQADPVNPSSQPQRYATAGATTFFVAVDGFGSELWRTDGTTTGTQRVSDIHPGTEYSSPSELVALGSNVLFVATDPAVGRELFVSDGTTTGTVLVKDIAPGPASSSITDVVAFGGFVWFAADDGTNGKELWRSDGTTTGTALFADIEPGASSSGVEDLVVSNGFLYFEAGSGNTHLWRTDGVTTSLVSTFGSGISLRDPVDANGALFFVMYDTTHDYELWTSDGTAAGTHIVEDINPNFSTGPTMLTAVGSRVYFVHDDGATGKEVWVSDGTSGGTNLVVDANDSYITSSPGGLIPLGNELLFTARNPSGAWSIWKTGGVGATELKDLGTFAGGYAVSAMIGGVTYFLASQSATGFELWRTDGTPAGTFLAVDLRPGPASGVTDLLQVGTEMFLTADDGTTGFELWRSDGTPSGTTLVRDIRPAALSLPSSPELLRRVGPKLFFYADDGVAGREPWVSDGTTAGTMRIADLNSGPASSDPGDFLTLFNAEAVELGDRVVFNAKSTSNGVELFVTDGTAAGTQLIDVKPGSGGSEPTKLTRVGDVVYFSAKSAVANRELWRTDGTVEGTWQVTEIVPGGAGAYFWEMVELDGKLVISVNDDVHGSELWISEGTDETTVLLADVVPGPDSSLPQQLTPIGSYLYFRAGDNVAGIEMWRTNGTTAGTEPVVDLNPGPGPGWPSRPVDIGGAALFYGWQGVGFEEGLYATDGTAIGTFEVASDVEAIGGLPPSAVSLGDVGVLWGESGGVNGLWASDGTVAGTGQIAGFDGKYSSSFAIQKVGSGPRAILQGNDSAFGSEVWVTDGTAGGTTRLTDIAPGPFRASPENFQRVGDTIFFAADDGEHGTELHAIPFALTGDWVAEPFGLGCVGATGQRPRASASGAATIGSTLSVEVTDAFPGTLGVLFFSPAVQYVGVGSGCTSYVGTPFFTRLAATDGAGAGSRTFNVPNDPGLVDAAIYFQWAIVDPAGPFFGTVLSDGLEVRIGM